MGSGTLPSCKHLVGLNLVNPPSHVEPNRSASEGTPGSLQGEIDIAKAWPSYIIASGVPMSVQTVLLLSRGRTLDCGWHGGDTQSAVGYARF